jgi:hypothetical protein
MGDQENTENQDSALVDAAKVVGTVVGKIAGAVGAGGEAAEPIEQPKDLYRAEYLGSGTFLIKKPKRKSRKTRQSQLKNPQRGSRK